MDKEDIKVVTTGITLAVLVLLLVFYALYAFVKSDVSKLNVCAKEQGYPDVTILSREGDMARNYTYKVFNDTSFACCLRQDYISEGDIKHWNCVSIHQIEEIK
jgi:hypothetical protein